MKYFLIFFILSLSYVAQAKCTIQIKMEGIIGAGVQNYIEKSLKVAEEKKCESILMLINTPGGQLQTTHNIVKTILNSNIPFLCLVAPPGGRAGSAGAIILQACHVSGAMEATNIGAATPVSGVGENMGEDLRKKILNDTLSWLEGITKQRGRNLKFSKEIVTEAKSVEANEALRLGAIDTVVNKVEDFLKFAANKTVKLTEGKETTVVVGTVVPLQPDSKFYILQLLSDPQITYLLFMVSIGLLYFEITHTGLIAPGVVGGLGLILSLMSFQILDVWWGGLFLMVLGIGFLIAEAFLPSFGVLGIGGIISFVLGGLFLFDEKSTAVNLPLATIISTAIGMGGLMLVLAFAAFKTRHRKVQTGKEELLGKHVPVVNVDSTGKRGKVRFGGELWSFESEDEIKIAELVVIQNLDGLKLLVKPVRRLQ